MEPSNIAEDHRTDIVYAEVYQTHSNTSAAIVEQISFCDNLIRQRCAVLVDKRQTEEKIFLGEPALGQVAKRHIEFSYLKVDAKIGNICHSDRYIVEPGVFIFQYSH